MATRQEKEARVVRIFTRFVTDEMMEMSEYEMKLALLAKIEKDKQAEIVDVNE